VIASVSPAARSAGWPRSCSGDPAVQGRHELKRFKMLMETGEVATSRSRKAA